MKIAKEHQDKLMAPLPRDAVKSRTQSGQKLSYVEGWWVKDQLLDIFGPGNVGMEVVSLKCVSEYEEKVVAVDRSGSYPKKTWAPSTSEKENVTGEVRHRVSYVATVRAFVDGEHGCWQSEDVGAGHGIGACGDAHESASKEAVTDAMKRAFTFCGRKLGLALYDKKQENVGAGSAAQEAIDNINAQTDKAELEAIGKTIKGLGLSNEDLADVRKAYTAKLRTFEGEE